ncbi:hypothetical protein ACD591_04285 [Rufibacter glacialis]|uniref:Uncharacterized protein n=1 Tax=Rufibacter glacialis TaxID=1259555 RepID=A0A5M8QIG2_9BACT|nr:hypothetical protein [Rufibacter glacialis]KAA6434576.1 hypothetical protein FOE74_10350 [Rufibacter glacialis]
MEKKHKRGKLNPGTGVDKELGSETSREIERERKEKIKKRFPIPRVNKAFSALPHQGDIKSISGSSGYLFENAWATTTQYGST